MTRVKFYGLLLFACVIAWPAVASGQTSGIAGEVRDSSGGVLPGVTVEAQSPALIEGTRVGITDGQGRYNITALGPGDYVVTFALPGFSLVQRVGIVLTSGFTANVDATLEVGALEETITVTGATPLVDTQNVVNQTVLTREVLEALPTNRSIQGFAGIIPGLSATGTGGVMQDVGGNRGEQFGGLVIHGNNSDDGKIMFDGMDTASGYNRGGARRRFWVPSAAAVQEVGIETSGASAESSTGGVYQKFIPREGANTFSSNVNISFTNTDLQQSNLTPDHASRGLDKVADRIKEIYDYAGGVGGPIKTDKLWFYGSARRWGTLLLLPNDESRFYNAEPKGTPFYTPDFDREEASNDYELWDVSGRFTWQAAAQHKINIYQSVQSYCLCGLGGGFNAPEVRSRFIFKPTRLTQVTYSYPVSSRMLIEAGVLNNYSFFTQGLQPGISPSDIPYTELSTGFLFNAGTGALSGGSTGVARTDQPNDMRQHNERFALSYVTGSHAFKTGVARQYAKQEFDVGGSPHGTRYYFDEGVPVRIRQHAIPVFSSQSNTYWSAFAQDQWSIRNLTLNVGVRWDQIKGQWPDQTRPAGLFTPELVTQADDDVVNLNDVVPRLGFAYDVFGDGRTAVKAVLGKYLKQVGVNITASQNPANRVSGTADRTWDDRNEDLIPDCDLRNFDENGECGATGNAAFGTVRSLTRQDEEILRGFGNRAYMWQGSLAVEHEVRPGLGLNVGYFRTWYGNFQETDNILVGPEDFDSFCLTAPSDPRLPGGGGFEICDLSDVTPEKFRQVENVISLSDKFGDRSEIYDGVDATIRWRFGDGGLLQGGMNVGRTAFQCVVIDAPVPFCNDSPPFQHNWKFSGAYPLPVWDIQVSGTIQLLPGSPIGAGGGAGDARSAGATWVVSNDVIAPVLGRDLSQGSRGRQTVQLFANDHEFEEGRLKQIDIRISKSIDIGLGRVQGQFDLYNILNSSNVLAQNIRFGPNYRNALQIIGARMVKFGLQLDF